MERNYLIKELEKAFQLLSNSERKRKPVIIYCTNQYGVPFGRIADLINGRIPLSEEKDSTLFFVAAGVADQIESFKLTEFFTQEEIEQYKGKRFTAGDIEFPLEIECIEIEKGRQWVGSIDAQTLIRLDRSGLIRYNKAKQRTCKVIYKGQTVDFQIAVVDKSVNQIAKLMLAGEYIPDDITLDIPDDLDTTPEYRYDENTHRLIFDSLQTFDITDGYHRFLAMERCVSQKPDFNYPMEIRITAFTEQRSREFIWQKDQKNKMTVSQSKSMNINRPSNDVVDMINAKGYGSNYSGLIPRSGGRVDYVALSDIIEYYYFHNKGRKPITNKEVFEVAREVIALLNEFSSENVDYLDKNYLDFKQLIILFHLIKDNGESVREAGIKLQNAIKSGEIKKITVRTIRKNLLDQIDTMDFS